MKNHQRKTGEYENNRRKLLKLLGVAGAGALAGCDGGGGGTTQPGDDGDGTGTGTDDGGSTTGDGDDDLPIDLSSFRDADINWEKHDGTELTLGFVEHTFVDNFRPLTPAFEELTGIDVEWQILPEQEFRTTRQSDVSTGAGEMDVFMIDQVIGQFLNAEWLQTLDSYMEDDELYDEEWYQPDGHFEAALTAAHGQGTTDQWTGVPITTETTATFYRTDLYDEHDLDEPETMEELRENAQVISENEDVLGVVGRGARGYGMNAYVMNSYIRSWGGELWTSYPDDSGLDSSEAINAGEFYVNLLNDYGPSDAESYTWSDALSTMQQGEAGHFVNDANLFWGDLTDEENSQVADDIGITTTPVPDVDGGQFAPNAFTWTIATSQASDNSEAAFLFMLFASSPETNQWMGENGATYLTRSEPWEQDWYQEQVNPTHAEIALESLEGAIPDTFDARYPEWAEEYSVQLQSAISGEKDVEQAFEDAAAEAEDIAQE